MTSPWAKWNKSKHFGACGLLLLIWVYLLIHYDTLIPVLRDTLKQHTFHPKKVAPQRKAGKTHKACHSEGSSPKDSKYRECYVGTKMNGSQMCFSELNHETLSMKTVQTVFLSLSESPPVAVPSPLFPGTHTEASVLRVLSWGLYLIDLKSSLNSSYVWVFTPLIKTVLSYILSLRALLGSRWSDLLSANGFWHLADHIPLPAVWCQGSQRVLLCYHV